MHRQTRTGDAWHGRRRIRIDPKVIDSAPEPMPAGGSKDLRQAKSVGALPGLGDAGRSQGATERTMAHAPHAKVLPADLYAHRRLSRRWRAKALMMCGFVCGRCAIVLAFLDRLAGACLSGLDLLGLVLTFCAFGCGGRPGAADGAVRDGRQVGPAAAAAAGGDEPDVAAGAWCIWLILGFVHEAAVSVGGGRRSRQRR